MDKEDVQPAREASVLEQRLNTQTMLIVELQEAITYLKDRLVPVSAEDLEELKKTLSAAADVTLGNERIAGSPIALTISENNANIEQAGRSIRKLINSLEI